MVACVGTGKEGGTRTRQPTWHGDHWDSRCSGKLANRVVECGGLWTGHVVLVSWLLDAYVPCPKIHRYGLDNPGFDSQLRLKIFFFLNLTDWHWGSPSLLFFGQWGCVPQGLKWPGSEVDHASPSNAKVKNEWSYTPFPLTALMACMGQLNLYVAICIFICS